MSEKIKITGVTETFVINIPEGQNTFIYTFTGTYNVAPSVLIEPFGKRVDTMVITNTEVTITLLDTDGVVDGAGSVAE